MSSQKRSPDNFMSEQGRLSVVYDLYIDLLGTLVPGLMTVILGVGLIFYALSTIDAVLFSNNELHGHVIEKNSTKLETLITQLHWEFSTVIIVSAYVIGSVFFRQDPKVPDAISALHIWMNSTNNDRKRLAVQSTKNLSELPPLFLRFFKTDNSSFRFSILDRLRPNFLRLINKDKSSFGFRVFSYFQPIFWRLKKKHKLSLSLSILSYIRPKLFNETLGLDTQFPYSHLRCYLASRQLIHLSELIPWCPNEKNTEQFRTKMFINIIKIRLLSQYQNLSKELIRNEAHVRLATSVWYAASTLYYLSFTVIIALLGCSAYNPHKLDIVDIAPTIFMPIASAGILILFYLSMKYHLIKCIHYMRVREVVYVLEAAYMVKMVDDRLFDGLFDT
ncbi:MAG: hypothetical protein JZU65_23290 [Chlorobium sp.]|jgi:hypothetical protein|nr:hypothetical protein [Chlorobium sp.]